MSGLGDPIGLVSDESDFLFLPSRITNVQGLRYYGDSRFLYRDVLGLNWNARLNGAIMVNPVIIGLTGLPPGPFTAAAAGKWHSSGEMYDFGALIGAAFPAGAGRIGVFFDYLGRRGDYSGAQIFTGGPISSPNFIAALSSFDMDTGLDNFYLRVIYGQPTGWDLNLGMEMQIAHVQERNDLSSRLNRLSVDGNNVFELFGLILNQKNDFTGELFPFMMPFDDGYWEILFKAGLEGSLDPVWLGIAVRGGLIADGDNSWTNRQTAGIDIPGVFSATARNAFKLRGDVSGFKTGADLWARYPYSSTISFPFSIRIDYRDKSRDGAGIGVASLVSDIFTGSADLGWRYNNTENDFDIEAGGGVDVQVNRNLKLAVGVYYNYRETDERFALSMDRGLPIIVNLEDNGFPDSTKHLLKLKVAAEQSMGGWMLRGGFSLFCGLVEEDYSSLLGAPLPGLNKILNTVAAIDGEIWGLIGSMGATFKLDSYSMEPFIQAGYQSLSVGGSCNTSVLGGLAAAAPWVLTRDRSEALVGAGLSVRF